MVAFTKHDLQFILDGITVSEEHADQTNDVVGNVWLQSDIETSRQILRGLLPNSLEPIGVRTIDGSLNNLEFGQDQFGATGNEFPTLTDAEHRDDGATTGDGSGNPADGAGGGFFGVTNTDYAVSDGPGNTSGSNGNVVDSDPRIISNLLADQSLANPAAVARAEFDPATYDAGADGIVGTADDVGTANGSTIIDPNGTPGDGDDFFFIPNVAPDEGLSAPFNSWMTFFGQFFDHGLDLIQKGDSGTIFIPLADDDPLVTGPDGVLGDDPTTIGIDESADDLAPHLRFMALTRATVDPGADGVLGTADDVRGPENFTSPFVDQNQTYTSHPSHQIFLREYVENATAGLTDNQGNPIPIGAPVATGKLIEGPGGGMATWGDVKSQAADLLGIELTDAEAIDIPLFAVDQYGEFIRGASGLPQYVLERPDGVGGIETTLIEGNLADPVSIAEAEAAAGGGFEVVNTKFQFLLDIAHNAAPVFDAAGNLVPDGDTDVGNPVTTDSMGNNLEYDNELLDAHFIAGDGRANENFALTAVHHVFHQEHNRIVEHTKDVLLHIGDNGDLGTIGDDDGAQAALDLLNGYLEVPVLTFPTTPGEIAGLVWDGDRLFQASKFATEMQYQHLVFEEFARKVQPLVDIFASFEPSIDASITMEFSQAVYRFGHSMLTENVDLMQPDGTLTEAGLIQAFLNPIGFNQFVNADGTVDPGDLALQDSSAAAGAIIRGMTRETGNEIDEFVTDALRNNLLGLPLDLAAINIARGRDVGIPTLNEVRTEFFEGTGDTKLKPYDSWFDFAINLKNELSVVNFIAAYGQHDTIVNATTLADKRAAAFDLVVEGTGSPADRVEFLTSTGAWAGQESGLNLVDLWIGGLAEATEPFGGMLGSTFNFVFEEQLEDLQDGDRFYYLGRTGGLNFVTQLEQNSFANMIVRNTDIGDNGADHLPGDIFSTPHFILEVDQSRQVTGLDGPGTAIIESGTVTIDQASSATWHTVTFDQSIADAVVAMMINTSSGANPTTVRVRNITDDGFEFQMDEYDYLDGAHVTETLSWVAVAEGEHTLSDGSIVKAGTTTEDAAGSSNVSFGGSAAFTGAPVLLTQVSTVNEDTAITSRVQNIDATGFNLRLREQEAGAGPNGTAHATETVGWIAIQAGDGTLLNAGTSGDGVTHNTATVGHGGGAFTDPAFVAQMQSRDGNDTATVRGVAVTATDAQFFIEEEQSSDAETNHTGENVGFLVLPSGVITTPNPLNGRFDPTGDSILIPLVMRDDPSTVGPDSNFLRYTGGDHVVLGGTEMDDTLIGGKGDDTLHGDGGNDILEGGDGGDIILGGAGDDIITDIGGLDNLQGGDGNDAIASGAGEDLILAGAGKDFVLQGPDLSEAFGGLGDDFIHLGSESNLSFGGEGNDWMEGGGGNNLLQGDNGDPFLNSTIAGHDVFLSGQGDDDYDAEGGDDIMEGSDGVQRFEGVNGFDWATYKDVELGINVDMLLRAFDETPIPPSNATIQDRFDSVEGLSGGRGSDIIRGDDSTRVEAETVDNGNDSVLRTDARFEMIRGLRAGDNGGLFDNDGTPTSLFNPIFDASTIEWGEGNILLGGSGSDLIEGRGGDDIIDGDLKLDVRILITDGGGTPIATAYKMQGQMFQVDGDGNTVLVAGERVPIQIGGHDNLHSAVFDGVINPGNLEIVREIIDESADTDFDTAEFSDVISNYTLEETAPGVIGDNDGDGYIRVSHDSVAGANDGLGADGVDLVRSIERLQFADATINLGGGNSVATGAAAIVIAGTTTPANNPFVGQQLGVDVSGIMDADGTANSTFVHIWQVEEEPGVFVDLIVVGTGGEDTPMQGNMITVPQEAEGLALRVRTVFQDDGGVFETVFSGATSITAPQVVSTPTTGDDVLLGTIGPDIINGLAGNDIILGLAGDDTLRGGPGADELTGGTGNDTVNGNGGNDEIFWATGDGRDVIDGGGGNADVFDVTGDATAETFRVIAVTPPNPDPGFGPLAPDTEIIVTRNNGSGEVVIAELRRIEELVINGVDTAAGGGAAGGDTVLVVGDFTDTSLALATITFNGTDGDDVVDISGLSSAHRIVFRSNGGEDLIVGNLRPQDVIELAPGLARADYDDPEFDGAGTWTIKSKDGVHSISYPGDASTQSPNFAETSTTQTAHNFDISPEDIHELKNLVRGLPSDLAEDHATGIRDLEGTGNNPGNSDFGSADQPFIRLTDARYGEFDPTIGNNQLNPIFDGLDPRGISNIMGAQGSDEPKSAEDANIFFMAFGQYFDHGLDFLPKGGNGTVEIGTDPNDDPADLTRGSVDHIVDGVPQHLNKTSPFVDQNQAYGSTELVGILLREGDGNGGLTGSLLAGAPDPSNPDFNLLPTLREVLLHHWDNNTVFSDPLYLPNGPITFRDYFTDLPFEDASGTPQIGTLVDAGGNINEGMIPFVNGDFMGSGHTLVGDANPFINLLDHFVAGDLRANENYTLTSIHTIWARNHNFHAENLEANGFDGTDEELFQAAKIFNETEYQRVVFTEFADKLLGGLKGSGEHGHDDYNPGVDARISHEFAAAVYRVGHSLISQTITVIGEDGTPMDVPLTDAFLNPTNDNEAFTAPLPPGYIPQPGFEQLGVGPIVSGITGQLAEEVDYKIVDAVRNDLVRIQADLFSFNVARGRDVGLGTLNQVRSDLLESTDPYVMEAVERSGEDLSPYSSWQDFQQRNGLSATVLAQFMAAYPDLVLASQNEIDAFKTANPSIELVNGNTVKGIDRVDLWVGGLAEEHINGGVVGATFWVVLHEQFDRLQEGDRFYYLDRVDDFDFYNQVEDQSFSDIIARNTGLEGLPDDVFGRNGRRQWRRRWRWRR